MTAPTRPLPPAPTPTPPAVRPTPLAHQGTTTDSRTSLLLYGVPKVGKTHNALTFPKPLVLAICSNTGTLDKAGVPYLVPSTWGDTWQGFRTQILPVLKAREAHKFLGPDAQPGDVQTIVLDEVNTLVKLLEDSITAGDPGRKWSHGDFGRLAGELNPVLRELAGLKNPRGSLPRYNVVATCHVRDVNDAEGTLTAVQPIIMGQTRDILGAYFDLVVLLTKELVGRVDPTTKLASQVPTFFAYTAPPDRYHARLGLGGSVGSQFPAKLPLTGPTTLREEIAKHLDATVTLTTTSR